MLHAVEYAIDGQTRIWIIDGQHRLKALLDLGLGDTVVQVEIHLDAHDDARASQLFLKLNNRLAVHPFDKFWNAVHAEHYDAVGVVKLINRLGLVIERSSKDGRIACVTTLTATFRLDNGATLTSTLDTLLEAWGHTAPAVEGSIIQGLATVYRQFDGALDRPALVAKLGKYPGGPSGLLGDARGMQRYRKASISRCIAERIIEMYNSGRRVGRLDPL